MGVLIIGESPNNNLPISANNEAKLFCPMIYTSNGNVYRSSENLFGTTITPEMTWKMIPVILFTRRRLALPLANIRCAIPVW